MDVLEGRAPAKASPVVPLPLFPSIEAEEAVVACDVQPDASMLEIDACG